MLQTIYIWSLFRSLLSDTQQCEDFPENAIKHARETLIYSDVLISTVIYLYADLYKPPNGGCQISFVIQN